MIFVSKMPATVVGHSDFEEANVATFGKHLYKR
jgi:hypothetical protein